MTIKSIGEDVEKRGPLCPGGGNVNYCSHDRKHDSFLKKIKNRTTIWSSNSHSGCLSKENKNTNWKKYVHTHVHCSIIYSNQESEII